MSIQQVRKNSCKYRQTKEGVRWRENRRFCSVFWIFFKCEKVKFAQLFFSSLTFFFFPNNIVKVNRTNFAGYTRGLNFARQFIDFLIDYTSPAKRKKNGNSPKNKSCKLCEGKRIGELVRQPGSSRIDQTRLAGKQAAGISFNSIMIEEAAISFIGTDCTDVCQVCVNCPRCFLRFCMRR